MEALVQRVGETAIRRGRGAAGGCRFLSLLLLLGSTANIDTRLPHELFVSTFSFFFLSLWQLKNDLTLTEDGKEHKRARNISGGFDSRIDLGKSDTRSRP